MKKSICRITIDTDRKLANTVIAPLLLDNCINFSIKDIEIAPQPQPNGRFLPAVQNFPRERGDRSWINSAAPAAIVNAMEHGKEYYYKTLAQALAGVGMNPTSATPCLSWMVREKLVVRVTRGRYRLP